MKDHIYTDVLSSTLAFLLVFRLNRAALRWWDTRRMWGAIVANARMMADGFMTHMSHAPEECDDAIKWLAGFLIATKQHLRNYGKFYIDSDELAGFLSKDDILLISASPHPVLFTTSRIRLALKQAFQVSPNTSAAIGAAYSSQMCFLEQLLNDLINNMGGLERVKGTPLPMAFVAHLRTFCMLYLLSMPYLYANTWGWGTISSVFLTSFALLGIDGAASECERPFKIRPNALNMEGFCLTGLNNIAQAVLHHCHFKKIS
jgi:putative membrane protein